MLINRLRLWHFKNYTDVLFEFVEGINLLTGRNGVGKTNVLDAIHFLALAKPHSNLTDAQLGQNGSSKYRVEVAMDEEGQRDIFALDYQSGKKAVLKNGEQIKRLADHIGDIPLVSIFPDDDEIVRGDSSLRRRMLDQSISQLHNDYLEALMRYKRCLRQRNMLLKSEGAASPSSGILLDSYDMELVSHEVVISKRRHELVEQLSPIVAEFYKSISEEGALKVELNIRSNYTSAGFADELRAGRDKDIWTKRTNIGPHRDDLTFKLDGRLLRKFGSQGQRKSFLISLKLAKFVVFRHSLKRRPLLLLDDIFDKLDAHRVERLLSMVCNLDFDQVFITHTGTAAIADRLKEMEKSYKVYDIERINPTGDEEE